MILLKFAPGNVLLRACPTGAVARGGHVGIVEEERHVERSGQLGC